MQRSFLTWIMPLVLIVLAIPMVLGKVPRNALYGFRTAYTMSSDEVWYRANRISGIAIVIAGVFWLALAWLLPLWIGARAEGLVQLLGVVALGISIAVSAWLTYKK